MISYEAALIVFLVSFLLSRLVLYRAVGRLSEAQKAALVETFARLSRYTLLPAVGLVGVYLLVLRGMPGEGRGVGIGMLVALGLTTVAMQAWGYRQLSALGLEAGYLRRFLLSRVLLLLGMGGLIASVIFA